MKSTFTRTLAIAGIAMTLSAGSALAHCQIPCGIYGDSGRFETLHEHIRTVEKAMASITALSAKETPNYNQIARWVSNKEAHANAIQEIALQYFLAQRVKPGVGDSDIYHAKLAALHEIIVYAMKSKQTTDVANAAKMRDAVKAFYTLYVGKPKTEGSGHKH